MTALTRPSRQAVIVVIASAVLVWAAGAASAHSVLISMNPPDGSTVSSAPTRVVLTFNENIQDLGDGVVVTAPDGTRVDNGPPSILDATVTEQLKPLALSGHYIVSYRVVSADGHPVTRTLGFTYTGGTRPPAGGTASAPRQSPPTGRSWGWVLVPLIMVGVAAIAARKFLSNRAGKRERIGQDRPSQVVQPDTGGGS